MFAKVTITNPVEENMMTTANTIESFFALINLGAKNRSGAAAVRRLNTALSAALRSTPRAAPAPARLDIRHGDTLNLPAGRHVTVLAGRLWLTHHGDRRDHFPRAGDSFDTTAHSHSVVQAFGDSALLIE